MDRVASRSEPSLEQQQLSRFAGAVDTLDGYQPALIWMWRFEQGPGRGLGGVCWCDMAVGRFVAVERMRCGYRCRTT